MLHLSSFRSWENAVQPWILCCTSSLFSKDLRWGCPRLTVCREQPQGWNLTSPRVLIAKNSSSFSACFPSLPSLTVGLKFLLHLSSDPHNKSFIISFEAYCFSENFRALLNAHLQELASAYALLDFPPLGRMWTFWRLPFHFCFLLKHRVLAGAAGRSERGACPESSLWWARGTQSLLPHIAPMICFPQAFLLHYLIP